MRLCSLVLLLGCAQQVDLEHTADAPLGIDEALSEAAHAHDVPRDLLAAVGMAQTGLRMVDAVEEFEGRPLTCGVMGLSERHVDQVSVTAPCASVSDNVHAAAELMSAWAGELAIDRGDLDAWAPVVARYSGIESVDGQAAYVHDEVYAVLGDGAWRNGVEVEPRKVNPDFAVETRPTYAAGPDYSASVWRPSPNTSSRPSGAAGDVSMVIIHVCEGGYSGCWSWLANSASGVSAHYVVNESGSEISQLVRESSKGWHISASYDSGRNGGVASHLDGVGSNDFTVGVEHAGFSSQSSWSSGLIQASAELVCDITRRQGIARDAYHIVGHGQLQPWNRTDPGANWPWTDYLQRIQAACGGTGSGGSAGGCCSADGLLRSGALAGLLLPPVWFFRRRERTI